MKSIHSFIALIAGILLLSGATAQSYAAPAYSRPVQYTQPDGSLLTITSYGDEHFSYSTTEDGYVIFLNDDRYYVYAERDNNGDLVPSKVVARNTAKRSSAERSFLKAYKPFESFSDVQLAQVKGGTLAQEADLADEHGIQKFPTIGAPRGLVILVNFRDVKFTIPNAQEEYSRMLNEEGYKDNGAFGSARDYYRMSSMGKFSPQFDVFGPFDVPENYAYYGKNMSSTSKDVNVQQMVLSACEQAYNHGVDFANYDFDNDGVIDNVFFYYAGINEAENTSQPDLIWPHRSNVGYKTSYNGKLLYNYACTSELTTITNPKGMCGIGTFCHEFSHVLGLPDLYCTRACEFTPFVWDHDIMHAGLYNALGKCPPVYSAIERFHLGWLTPTILEKPTDTVALKPLYTSNEAIIVAEATPNLSSMDPNPYQFYLFENRQQIGFDTTLPGHGILVWKVQYSPLDWSQNTLNNDRPFESYTLSIVPADMVRIDSIGKRYILGTAQSNTYADYFPGTTMRTEFEPLFFPYRKPNDASAPRVDTVSVGKLTEIREDAETGMIYFKFNGGQNSPYMVIHDKKVTVDAPNASYYDLNIDASAGVEWTIASRAEVKRDAARAGDTNIRKSGDTIVCFTYSPMSGTGAANVRITALQAGSTKMNIDTLILTAENLPSKTIFVQQNPVSIDALGWVHNFDLSVDTLKAVAMSTVFSGGMGQLSGHNSQFTSEYAERFRNQSPKLIDSVALYPSSVQALNNSSKITLRIYDANGETPGTVLFEKDVAIKSLSVSNTTPGKIALGADVAVGADFFIGYQVFYNNYVYNTINPLLRDLFSLYVAEFNGRSTAASSAYLKQKFDTWMNFTEIYTAKNSASLGIEAHLKSAVQPYETTLSLKGLDVLNDTTSMLYASLDKVGEKPAEMGFQYSSAIDFSNSQKLMVPTLAYPGTYQAPIMGTKGQKIYYRAYATASTTQYSNIDSLVFGEAHNGLIVSPAELSISSRSYGIAPLNIYTNQAWTISTNVPWLHFETNSGTGNVSMNVAVAEENQSQTNERTDTVTITAGPFVYKLKVTQAVRPALDTLTVETFDVDAKKDIGGTNAILTGYIPSDGGGNILSRGFIISPKPNFDSAVVDYPSATNEIGEIRQQVTGLQLFTYYYFKAYASNEAGMKEGPRRNFKTLEVSTKPVKETKLKAYPNPVKSVLTINTNGQNIVNVRLLDMSGRMAALAYSKSGDLAYVDCKNLVPGVYVLHVQTLKGMLTERIIKQ